MQRDPSALLAELERKYVEFGAVKLVVCEEWKPPLTFRYIDKGSTTRVQILQMLAEGKVTIFNSTGHLLARELFKLPVPSCLCASQTLNLAL